jgi:hypothetical protein
MHLPSMSPDRLAALHDEAKQRAHELRREAIAELFARLFGWIARPARLPARRSAPCHS